MTQIITNSNGGGGSSSSGDMKKSVYDPQNIESDAFDYENFTNTPDLSVYQTTANLVTDLTNPDDTHYPSAKAVSDALSGAGAGDMLKSVYDPNSVEADAFDYDNFINTPTIPGVIDSLNSTSTTDALSANQGKELKDLIDTYVGLGRFLSLWDASTGQPISFPLTTPYTYNTGDWYMVEIVSSANPPVNYKPNGSSYTGTASTTQDTTNNVEVRDVYIYDGTDWLFQKNNEVQVSFSDIAGNPTDNTALANALNDKADTSSLATVATTGDYDDLIDKPTIGTATLTIQKNGTTVNTFGANATSNVTANITVPTKVSELSNDSGFVTNQVDDTAYAASWDGVTNKAPSKNAVYDKIESVVSSIPTVNDATLTIQKNGTTVNTFTANASSNVTANITVPTNTSDLNNDSGFLTSSTGVTSVNGQTGDVTVSGGHDYSRVTKSGNSIEIGLRTLVNIPTSDFTLTVPSELEDGMEYVIRITSEDSYTMTLGTGFTNPRNVDLSLSFYATDQFVFLAVGGVLELQPLVATGE